ncbi:MAG: GNAT family N-acetyltransferase [Lysobacteraceae bacterium]|nr:MAG: GNAT family N-acetyltransferase [Xanthomonadaceae bacterium]
MTRMRVSIARLIEHPAALPALQQLLEAEWPGYYGPSGPGDARADLVAYSSATRLPIGYVAFVDGHPCGLAALKAEPLPALPDLTPWASAGLVAPECRRRGIGARLLAALEDQARTLGFDAIYSGTNTANALLEREGWQFLQRVAHEGTELSVYRKPL